MNKEKEDYIQDMLDALRTETNERIDELKELVCSAARESEPEVHDIRVYSAQTPEEFEQMERNSRR